MKTTTIRAAIAAAFAIAASTMTAQADTYYWKTGGMFSTDAWTNAVGSAITVANSATYVDHDFVVNSGQDISSVAYADENNTECKFNHCRPIQTIHYRLTPHKTSLSFKKKSYLVAA